MIRGFRKETDSNPRSPVRRATLFETPVQLHPSRAACLGMLLCLPSARLLSLPDVPACGESVQASRRPETYRSRCSAFRRTQRSSTPTEILAPSLSTTSRASSSGKRMKPAIHDPFWYGQLMRTTGDKPMKIIRKDVLVALSSPTLSSSSAYTRRRPNKLRRRCRQRES